MCATIPAATAPLDFMKSNKLITVVVSLFACAGLAFAAVPGGVPYLLKLGTLTVSGATSLQTVSATTVNANSGVINTVNAGFIIGSPAITAGAITATSVNNSGTYTGDGGGLTNLNGSNVANGNVPIVRLDTVVTRSAATSLRIAAASASGAATCTMGRNNGVTSCSWNSTGVYQINTTAAGFGALPTCTASPDGVFGGTALTKTAVASASTTTNTYVTTQVAGVATDMPFNVICVGT